MTFAAFFLPGVLLTRQPFTGAEFNSAAFLLGSIVVAVPQFGLMVYVVLNIGGRSPTDYGLVAPKLQDLPLAVAIVAGTLPLVAATNQALSLAFGPLEGRNTLRWTFETLPLLPLLVLTALTTGYREEFYFRAYLRSELARLETPETAAVAASSLLFAACHLYQGLPGFLHALVLGLYFALVYRSCRSLHALAWGHAFYNTAVLLAGGLLFE